MKAEPPSLRTRSSFDRDPSLIRRAGLPPSRNLHRLRHTFCSHLAMRGAPAKVIQELAGHADLKTTMLYMHLARGSAEAAVALLEQAAPKAGDSGGTATLGRPS